MLSYCSFSVSSSSFRLHRAYGEKSWQTAPVSEVSVTMYILNSEAHYDNLLHSANSIASQDYE